MTELKNAYVKGETSLFVCEAGRLCAAVGPGVGKDQGNRRLGDSGPGRLGQALVVAGVIFLVELVAADPGERQEARRAKDELEVKRHGVMPLENPVPFPRSAGGRRVLQGV